MSKLIGNNNVRSKGEPWWHSLINEECPITLELLSTLPYPPFSLTSGGITSYFDGLALASYIVSRGIFQNPLTREDLTISDCRRLDEYLEDFCYDKTNHERQQLPLSSRKISVEEAFALRASVHVDQAHQNQSRAQALQNTATAALAGLFVYGNDRRRQNSHREEELPTLSMPSTLPREDQLTLDWGFDLTRTVDDSSTEFAQEGWTIIDDDEAHVVASQREAYQAAQNAFPPLLQHVRQDAAENDATATTNSNHANTPIDEHIVERVRELSLQEEQERARRERHLELTRQRLLQEALARREERQKKQRQQREKGVELWEKKKQEEEEIQRARAEIDQWREEQWKKLRLLSEARQSVQEQGKQNGTDKTSTGDTGKEEDEQEKISQELGPTAEEIAEQQKAKATAKRRRAKQRKKEQKAQERAEQEKLLREKELEAKKAASASQCDACGQGILDCGFEKFGKRFCSPKCARSAKPP